ALEPGKVLTPAIDREALARLSSPSEELAPKSEPAAPPPAPPAPEVAPGAPEPVAPPPTAPVTSGPKTGPTARLNPPPIPLAIPAPSSKAPSGVPAWLAIVAIALGGVVMIAGVVFAFTISRR